MINKKEGASCITTHLRQDLNVHLLKSESTDVEICLIVFVLILIDKVHHLFIGSFTLLYASL